MAETLREYEMDGPARIYRMLASDSPWGDYGDILIHGMSVRDRDGRLQLRRTGPHVPPITFPGVGDIVVTDEMKQRMEVAAFVGVGFRLVEPLQIVEVPWHTWDLSAAEPRYYPDGGEPESYILDEEHSAEAAAAMGLLWEVVLTDGAEVVRERDDRTDASVFRYVEGSWTGNDLFSVRENRYRYASSRAKRWLEKNAARWVVFSEGKATAGTSAKT